MFHPQHRRRALAVLEGVKHWFTNYNPAVLVQPCQFVLSEDADKASADLAVHALRIPQWDRHVFQQSAVREFKRTLPGRFARFFAREEWLRQDLIRVQEKFSTALIHTVFVRQGLATLCAIDAEA